MTHSTYSNVSSITLRSMSAWDASDPTFGRPLAAPLEQCAQLLGVDLATLRTVAADVEPYLRVDGTKVWSLMQLERRLRPETCGRVRGGYLSRRRVPATGAATTTATGTARRRRTPGGLGDTSAGGPAAPAGAADRAAMPALPHPRPAAPRSAAAPPRPTAQPTPAP
jgi:hypothetical protein